jgi:hypothetical protein
MLFYTSSRRARASSPTSSRSPFAQIWVINLFPTLRALLGILLMTAGEIVKIGLLMSLKFLHLAFANMLAVPRAATKAQKSLCPSITSSNSLISFSTNSSAFGISSVEYFSSPNIAPTELKISRRRREHRAAKLEQVSRSILRASNNLELFLLRL